MEITRQVQKGSSSHQASPFFFLMPYRDVERTKSKDFGVGQSWICFAFSYLTVSMNLSFLDLRGNLLAVCGA